MANAQPDIARTFFLGFIRVHILRRAATRSGRAALAEALKEARELPGKIDPARRCKRET